MESRAQFSSNVCLAIFNFVTSSKNKRDAIRC